MALPSWSGTVKLFNYVQCARPFFNYLCTNGSDKQCFVRLCIVPCNMYSRKADAEKRVMDMDSEPKPKKKKVFIPRVTLLTEANELSVVTMEIAEKIADRRNLKLVKIVDFDTKTERPTYKLMSTKEYLQEGMERKKAKKMDKDTALKPEKLISISSKIAEHDLVTKIKAASKLLAKKHEVRILVSADGNKEKAAAVGAQIESAVKELPVHVKVSSSSGNVKIYLRPIVDAETKDASDTETKNTKTEPPIADAS